MSVPIPLLEVRRLACRRGEVTLFEELAFTLDRGEVLQIEGANGSGKTSLLRILAGLTPADEGTVLWQGWDIRERRSEFHGQLAYLGHHLGLKHELTVVENLRAAAGIQGMGGAVSRLPGVLDKVRLDHRADLPVRALSAGQRQRVVLARLLLLGTVLWILDEPFTALDAAGVDLVRSLVEEHLEEGGVVILTSHQAVPLGQRLRKLALS
ncbi:cytochrome c biogenesis heme-transporting ATPase CcmA [Methyloparacoccus murrellii]